MDKFLGSKSSDSPSTASILKQKLQKSSRDDHENMLKNEGSKYNKNDQEDIHDLTMKLPVVPHMNKLEDNLAELNRDFEECSKIIDLVRGSFGTLEHQIKDLTTDMLKYVMEEALRVEKNFRKSMNVEKEEMQFLKDQVIQVTQDKVKLQQNYLQLEQRVIQAEEDVGFKNLADYRTNH